MPALGVRMDKTRPFGIARGRELAVDLDELLEACVVIDRDWICRYANEAAGNVARATPGDLVGQEVLRAMPRLAGSEVHARMARGLFGREAARFEAGFPRRDGTTAWFEVSVVPIPEGIAILAVDRSRRRDAEEMVVALERARREMAEAQRIAHVGSWAWDVASGAVAWSDECFRLFGLEPGGDAPTLPDQERLFAPASWKALTTAVAVAVSKGTPYELQLEIVSDRWRAPACHRPG